ncbi:type VII secretion target [Rhodococcus sp. HNM0569]|uniref:type VII secretion target n=1 Tax=Rhodococcus sp. HNM0569 TaxID=2716340 RepID=UPI00146EB27C|nr:type VII secretion target [Rhodococcus sp. HNM0569]NLU83603.1 WXG100 family type VII secretion target [Rhodococcus sp. HNM0569]
MSQPLWIDPAHVRSVAPHLDRIADRAAAALQQLDGVLAGEGECWGADETGANIAQMYVPRAEANLRELAATPQIFERTGAALRQTADSLEAQDQGNADALRWGS